MKNTNLVVSVTRRLWTIGLFAALPAVFAQDVASTDSADDFAAAESEDDVIMLSPFKVDTAKDQGYKVTNATSGTRLNTPIKDLPMPISVITEEFLRDTGATNIREALAYTAGIQLQSQNDQGTPGGAYQGPGGVNNPEGATANKSQTSYKIRGYITDAVLRDGFRRQHSVDSININRIEVAFGPTALLYGIGSFGGIVNYIPKAPLDKPMTEVALTAGSYGFMRGTLDTTAPLSEKWGAGYRVTAAAQSTEAYTDFYKEDHQFISPAIVFRPTKTTEVSIDFEAGQQDQSGVGFQRVRAMANVGVNNDQNEHVDFYTLPGTNPRKFRWSGPDTYIDSKSTNFRAQMSQQLGEHFHFLLGFNKAGATFQTRDVQGNLIQNQGPAELRGTVDFGNAALNPDSGSSNLNVIGGQVNDVVLQYFWNDAENRVTHEQVRAELNWNFDLFQDRNKWLRMSHSFLLGHSQEKQVNSYSTIKTPDGQWNYKSPLDLSPIRFGKQGNGAADVAMVNYQDGYSIGWNQSTYLVYSGKFLDDRIFVVSGVRKDLSDNFVHWHNSVWNASTDVRSKKANERTYSNGVSVALNRNLSVFALRAEGVQPNFSGAKDTTGNPIGPIIATSKEYGVKFDLIEGKLSGSVSKFKIKRTGTPLNYWWAPTSHNIQFDPNRPIIYNLSNFTPDGVAGGSNGGNGATTAALAQWNAGVSAGSIYQKNGIWYVNASQATGAAYLDKVFDETKSRGMSWPGWLYSYDSETNNAWNDIASAKGDAVIGSDEASGWSAELVFSPNNNLQVVVNYAHTQKIITSAGNFARYPHPEDRWAVWYFPNTDWGLTGKPLDVVYGDPGDSSTWTGIGYGTGEKQDDTPEHVYTMWGNYKFTEGKVKGLTVGMGATYESPREYQSGITHGGGQRVTDKDGNLVILKTDSRLNVNAMARYDFQWRDRDASVQVNINNLLDDRKLYGLIYAQPRTVHLEFSMKL